jgi:hypothetical protein
VAGSTTRRAIFKQAREWLFACQVEHSDCQRIRNGKLPTRLVAVEKKGLQICARLCDGLTLHPDSDYLTLSHCWGQNSFFTLKKQNLELLRESIPVSELPRVFQDAILVTHELGFSYIWIDALCIIQDSDGGSDWLRESLSMHLVYGNSICNLAATGFHDGQEGLFPVRQLSEILPPKLNSKHLDTNKPDTSYYVFSPDEWLKEIITSPLHTRGWVYQEQIMVKLKTKLKYDIVQLI